MAFYRIKQFYWALTSNVSFNDKQFIEIYLNDFEKSLFYRLSTSDQKHCIRVAQDIKRLSASEAYKNLEVDWQRLIKAGLLHDIGKANKALNFFDKSILVILDFISFGKLRKLKNIDKIYIYYYHGKEGLKLLENSNEDRQLLYIIENHHEKDVNNNIELNILKKCDNIN